MKEHLISKIKNHKKEIHVKEIRFLTESTYILSLERNGITFIPGQYMTVGISGSKEMREYSVYSGINENRLEFLIKEIEGGDMSKLLKNLNPGDLAVIDGPFGFFTINRNFIKNKNHLFIASGTGIAPFHSFALSFKGLNYKIIHGVKTGNETYNKSDYPAERYISCTSRDKSGDFHGRVTDYLIKNPVDQNTLCYLCGNSNMIYDTFDILRNQGVPSENVYMEVYF